MTQHSNSGLLEFLDHCPTAISGQWIERTFQKGVPILEQGSRPKQVHILKHGLVKAYHTTAKGSLFTFGLFSDGEIFGEIEAFTQSGYIATVEPIVPSEVLTLPLDRFFDWLKRDHKLSLFIQKNLADRLHRISEKAISAMSYPMTYSVLKIIEFQLIQSNHALNSSLLAEYLGTSVRAINRVLTNLKLCQAISVVRGEIGILSRDRIHELIHEYEMGSGR